MGSRRLWRPIKALVVLLLVAYFVSKIIDSCNKLQKREISLSLERIREELVEDCDLCYFSLSCQEADQLLK